MSQNHKINLSFDGNDYIALPKTEYNLLYSQISELKQQVSDLKPKRPHRKAWIIERFHELRTAEIAQQYGRNKYRYSKYDNDRERAELLQELMELVYVEYLGLNYDNFLKLSPNTSIDRAEYEEHCLYYFNYLCAKRYRFVWSEIICRKEVYYFSDKLTLFQIILRQKNSNKWYMIKPNNDYCYHKVNKFIVIKKAIAEMLLGVTPSILTTWANTV